MRQIPQNHIHTRSTPFWNKETAPAGIFERHLDKGTRPGVYPRLSVMQGAVKYLGYADEHCSEPEEYHGDQCRRVWRVSSGKVAQY